MGGGFGRPLYEIRRLTKSVDPPLSALSQLGHRLDLPRMRGGIKFRNRVVLGGKFVRQSDTCLDGIPCLLKLILRRRETSLLPLTIGSSNPLGHSRSPSAQ